MDKIKLETNGEMLVVSSNGTVMWVPPVIYRSTCPVDMSNFPFDTQVRLCNVCSSGEGGGRCFYSKGTMTGMVACNYIGLKYLKNILIILSRF